MIDDFYQAALAAMRHHLEEAGAPYTLDEGEIVIGGHRLGLSITFDDFVTQGELVLAPLDVQIHLDGDAGDRFRVGALGVGPDRTTALREAISEWHLLAAAPLLAALGAAVENRRAARDTQSLAGWDLFVGRVGVRGAVPAELRAGSSFYQQLLAGLRKVVAAWPAPTRFELRSIFVMAMRGPGESELQAAVDGMVHQELGQSLGELPWPTGKEAYLYKQLFVLRGGADT
jgi:hypothetical protein